MSAEGRKNSAPQTIAVDSQDASDEFSSAYLVDLLSGNNYRPTIKQKQELTGLMGRERRALTHIEQDIQDHEDQLEHIRNKIARLHTIRSQKISRIDLYLSLVAPVRLLPTEVIAHIITLAANSMPFGHDRNNFCMNMSQVCSAWRHAAHTTHGIWETLHLELDDICTPKQDLDRWTHPKNISTWISSWFRKARLSAPLTLLASERDVSDFRRALMPYARHAVIDLGPRFHRLRFVVQDIQCLRWLSSLPSGTFSALETVEICFSAGSVHTPTVYFFRGSSSLRNVSLITKPRGISGWTPLYVPSSLTLPWEQLHQLHLNVAMTLEGLTEILLQTSQLSIASFKVIIKHGPNTASHLAVPQNAIVRRNSLLALTVQISAGYDAHDALSSLHQLSFPNLETLHLVENWGSTNVMFFNAIADNVDIIRLRTLTISHVDRQSHWLIPLLDRCTLLENLAMAVDAADHRVFSLLRDQCMNQLSSLSKLILNIKIHNEVLQDDINSLLENLPPLLRSAKNLRQIKSIKVHLLVDSEVLEMDEDHCRSLYEGLREALSPMIEADSGPHFVFHMSAREEGPQNLDKVFGSPSKGVFYP